MLGAWMSVASYTPRHGKWASMRIAQWQYLEVSYPKAVPVGLLKLLDYVEFWAVDFREYYPCRRMRYASACAPAATGMVINPSCRTIRAVSSNSDAHRRTHDCNPRLACLRSDLSQMDCRHRIRNQVKGRTVSPASENLLGPLMRSFQRFSLIGSPIASIKCTLLPAWTTVTSSNEVFLSYLADFYRYTNLLSLQRNMHCRLCRSSPPAAPPRP